MPRHPRILLLVVAGLLISQAVWAHPVSYQGALSVMTWNQPYMNDIWTTYSYLPNAAVAMRYMRTDMKDGTEMKIYVPQADFLLYRKNSKTYQSNVYAYGGFGGETLEGKTSHVGLLGAEADAESRRYYGAAGFQALLTGLGPDVYQTAARLGVAAYPAEFDELGTWFIVAFQDNPQLKRRSDVTPYIRLMFRNVLAEAGVSVSGEYLFNFMVHF